MKLYFLLLITCFTGLSCSKDKEGLIPNVYVNYHTTLEYFQIYNKNGVLIVNNEGVAGLIIYHRPDNAYVAYDRCSSVNPEQKCAVTPDDPNLTATDLCNGAKFSLYDGSAFKAPAKRPLKQYQVNVTSFGISVIN